MPFSCRYSIGLAMISDMQSLSLLICSRGRPDELRVLVQMLHVHVGAMREKVPVEIVVVEDISSSESRPQPIESVQYLAMDELMGFGAIRQKAVEASSGEMIVFIDDDCIPCEGWLERLLEPFEDDEVVAVGGGILPQRGNSIASSIALIGLPAGGLPRLIASGGMAVESELLSTGNLALRRKAVVRAGGFDTAHHHGGEDQHLVAKLSGRKLFVPTALVEHRNRTSFGEVFRWFVRRGRGEYHLNRLAGMSTAASLLHPVRWSWSWRLLLLGMIGLAGGGCWVAAVLAAYYLLLGSMIYIRNSHRASVPMIEQRRQVCMRFETLVVAPAVRLCMDLGREFGRLAAASEEGGSDDG